MAHSIRLALSELTRPRAEREDDRRREFILNVLLLGLIVITAVADFSLLYNRVTEGAAYDGVPFPVFTALLALFVGLYLLSRRGYFVIASYAFLLFYFFAVAYSAFAWGYELPTVLLGFGLLILIAGVLITSFFGMLVTAVSAFFIIGLAYADREGFITPDRLWKSDILAINDAIVFAVLLGVAALVSWLSNREIERSLRRARRSEAELKRERDLLETKVAERTKALKQVELEKMSQLYRFAELGRHATGIFHELMNPLTAVALNVAELEKHVGGSGEVKDNLEQAIASARRMEKILQALRKQMGEHDVSVSYSLNEEIHQVMQLFEYNAKAANVALEFTRQHDVATYGNPLKFHQVVANLVSNAIDAYAGSGTAAGTRREVRITLTEHHDIVRLEVEDWGPGIPVEHLGKIFEPFFTTKGLERGTGIGLATVRHLVEGSLGGTVRAESVLGQGTKFIVEFAA